MQEPGTLCILPARVHFPVCFVSLISDNTFKDKMLFLFLNWKIPVFVQFCVAVIRACLLAVSEKMHGNFVRC